MSGRRPTTSWRGPLVWGIGLAVFVGCLVAFAGQVLFPVLAKLPGLIVCGGDELELVLRRRNSYAVCGGDTVVGYGTVLLVSSIVWSLVCLPIGLAFARWVANKAARGRR